MERDPLLDLLRDLYGNLLSAQAEVARLRAELAARDETEAAPPTRS